jgi:hypothetical protein
MLREYTDKKGETWRVWDVYPTARGGASSPSGFSDGWLCFESRGQKRRLAPIPPDWEVCDCSRLEELCSKAGFISRSPPSNESIPES